MDNYELLVTLKDIYICVCIYADKMQLKIDTYIYMYYVLDHCMLLYTFYVAPFYYGVLIQTFYLRAFSCL